LSLTFYAEKSFSFQSSVGAVKGENADASLLKFSQPTYVLN
jgi:hypothetical protein